MGLLLGDGAMLDALRHDEHLAFAQFDVPIPQLDRQAALQHQEEVVGVVVLVPVEWALHLHDHQVVAVELAYGAGAVVLGEAGQLLGQVDRVHDWLLASASWFSIRTASCSGWWTRRMHAVHPAGARHARDSAGPD